MNHTQETSLLLLAGGQGSRMAGKDKGLVLLKNKPLIQYVIESVPKHYEIIVCANRNIQEYRNLGLKVIKDKSTDFLGPMHVITELSKQLKTPYFSVLPCDTPFLPKHTLPQLLKALDNNHQASYAEHKGRSHYCCMAAKTKTVANLNKTPRSMYALLNAVNASAVEIEADNYAFLNINTDQSLREAEEILTVEK